MFEELKRMFGWEDCITPTEQLVLLNVQQLNGEFVLHHLLSMCVKCQYKICFVSIAQTFAHYAQAGNKIGNIMEKAKSDDDLIHIDIMSNWFSYYIDSTKHFNLNQVHDKIFQEITKFKAKNQDQKCAIIFDDLSIFCHLGMKYFEVYKLIQNLISICKTLNNCVIIVAINGFTNQNEEIEHLSNALSRLAETSAETLPLKSGYSKDVHGQFNLKFKNYVTGETNKQKEFHYKLSDKSLSLFAKGTSSAVL